ncbi:hypothetical protein Y900_029055 [Mycolicibacterium aromaticivorans JS19b1 = JCM 16368]|uniref:Uncharacterized protein n=1 Tax=Mycolicibacterium aromaticivorans JS19b1 = JCM 16368 TaxID=1440774 RepID=A0A064CEZ9_9MYCO|nr:hypothetical protein [Mycolicibacterium aromaticivorans]KDE97307.1 hypothetical protein Y900_029055 [Mycolicibacterium aromaticivorans JS19b1 = JCM 16368]
MTTDDIGWLAVSADRLTIIHPDAVRELLSMFIHTPDGRKPKRCVAPGTPMLCRSDDLRNGFRNR